MEDRGFFNPYTVGPNFNLPPNISLPPNVSSGPFLAPSPVDFYNNQYYYYRYLNEYLDYSIKSAEYEKKFTAHNNNTDTNLKG